MDENNKNELFDLGSDPVEVDFDPFEDEDFADDDSQADIVGDDVEAIVDITQETETEMSDVDIAETPVLTDNSTTAAKDTATNVNAKALSHKEPESLGQDNIEKPPVFEYAGATENIDNTSKTFDELRIEKSADFPELEDGKRVSWTVEYGKITKTVADPKGMSIGKMKSDIETSKEFTDSLKKAKDKNPVCKAKPRVTAQSKGLSSSYKGVFSNLEEAENSGKVISLVPGKDGKVYEIRNTVMGKFITPINGSDLLSDVRAGFIPALPHIPMEIMLQIINFFRHYMSDGVEREVLVNVYWDKQNSEYVVDAPEQTVTKASVESHENLDFADDRYIHYMDIHSHNSMKAFFSGIDDKDEQATRLYSVIGNLQEYFPHIKTRISNGGKFLEIDPAEVFEFVAKPFPHEWNEKVRFNMPNDNDKEVDVL